MHCRAVDLDDDVNRENLEQMQGDVLQTFKARSEYRNWRAGKQSCLLILSGYNHESIHHTRQCWLSSIAKSEVDDIQGPGNQSICAYHAFIPGDHSIFYGLPVIFLQLLRRKVRALRDGDRNAELESALHRYQHAADMHEHMRYMNKSAYAEMVKALTDVCVRVMGLFDQSEELFIIVDGVDRCGHLPSDHRKTLIRLFNDMVKSARCKLRIMALCDGRYWPVERQMDDIIDKEDEQITVCVLEQQEKED